MAMNPGSVFKVLQMKKKFEDNHPKAAQFIQNVLMGGLPEGTVIEMRVTKPGETPVESNMKVNADDIELVNELKNMGH